MTPRIKFAFTLAGALLLGGCAAGPYYDNNGYNYGYGYDAPAPAYYGPSYVEPSIGFGIGFSDYSGHRHWDHDRRDWNGSGREWHGDRGGHEWHGDRAGHEWHGDHGHDHDGDHHSGG